jgi:3D (Asp-Asp-Asp) domain-containing protein
VTAAAQRLGRDADEPRRRQAKAAPDPVEQTTPAGSAAARREPAPPATTAERMRAATRGLRGDDTDADAEPARTRRARWSDPAPLDDWPPPERAARRGPEPASERPPERTARRAPEPALDERPAERRRAPEDEDPWGEAVRARWNGSAAADDEIARPSRRRERRDEAPPRERPRARDIEAAADVGDGALFELTYYDFPVEGAGKRDSVIYDAACKPIAEVTTTFHDQVCVQGSGRLASGGTVSFAVRGCSCAAECPRTGQHICFERLDPVRFPNGRGAMGRAITPLYTVAVDPTVIPLGTRLFIPELVGLPRADGAGHDGCFVAEDRGLRVLGHKIDVFTGDAATTAMWRARVAPRREVHVLLRDPRCGGRSAR